MIRKSAIKTLYSSPLLQLSRYNRTSFSQNSSFRLHEQSYSTSSESEKLLDIFNRLREFHRANVRPDQHGKVSFEGVEEQALMEWKWLRQSINQREKTKREEFGILKELVERLSKHEPLAYVLGDQPFGPLTILCKPPTLIPRSETEFLTEYLFERIQSQLLKKANEPNSTRRSFRILDICTGSGCIALLLRHRIMELTDSIEKVRNATDHALFEVVGVDNSDIALQHAKENLKHYNDSANHQSLISRTNQNVSIRFEWTDLLNDDSIRDLVNNHGPFDVIICNPPYIPANEWTALDKSVKEFEDRNALVGHMQNDADGLYYYRRMAQLIQSEILSTSVDSITSDLPLLAVEVGHDQAKRVKEIFEREGGTIKTEIWKDPYDVERAVLCQIPKM